MGTAHAPSFVTADDPWVGLNGGLETQLAGLHREIREKPELTAVDRIAVAVHDPASGRLRTFVESNIGSRPFDRFSDRLELHPTLAAVATTGIPFINNAIGTGPAGGGDGLNDRLRSLGLRSRYIVRIHRSGTLYGFIFFNSGRPGFFTEATVAALAPYRRLIDVLVVGTLTSQRTMLAAVRSALQVSHYRNEETGAHLDRMSRYAELIAQTLAARYLLSDEFVEYVLQYAPLHDIGKVAVPDHILLKRGKLLPDEYEVMKTHVTKGVEIIDAMIHDHGLEALPYRDLLRNVVAHHHECYDGSGYPHGLAGEAISLEGRIVAVADVFDALTSQRPYKEAWSNDTAAAFLRAQAGRRFDPACVEALLADPEAIRDIQQRFRETPSGFGLAALRHRAAKTTTF